jgi:hypothetical protein
VSWQKLPKDVLSLANDWFWADFEGGGLQATMDPKGLGSGFANQQKYLGAQLQQRGWAIDIDDEYENIVLKNQQGQTVLLPIEDAQDFTGWAQGTNSVSEQGMAEGSESKKFKVTYELQNGDVKEKIMIGKDANAVAKYFEFKYRHKPISVVEQGVAEGMSDDMAALAQKMFPNAYISKDGEEVQKPKNWGKRYTPPAAAPADLEKQRRDLTARYPNIDELVRRAELNRDPNYEMADGPAYYAARDAEQNYQKLRQIQRVIQGLNESLQRTQP